MATKTQAPAGAAGRSRMAVTVQGPVEMAVREPLDVRLTVERERPLLPPPSLPVPTPPAAVGVRLAGVKGDKATLALTVSTSALIGLLDETFSPLGWCCRRYACGGTLYTALGLLHPSTGQFEYKDAPAMPEKRGGADPAGAEAGSSLARAAAMWGICRDVWELGPVVMSAGKAGALAVASADGKTIAGYRLAQPLRVEQFGRDEAGHIMYVEFVTAAGAKFVWPES